MRKVQRKPTIFSRGLLYDYDHYSNASLTVTWLACAMPSCLSDSTQHSSPSPPSLTRHLPPLECKYWKTHLHNLRTHRNKFIKSLSFFLLVMFLINACLLNVLKVRIIIYCLSYKNLYFYTLAMPNVILYLNIFFNLLNHLNIHYNSLCQPNSSVS